MPQTDFFDVNRFRDYPMVVMPSQFWAAIVDVKFIIDESVNYRHGEHRVYLASLLINEQVAHYPAGPMAIFRFIHPDLADIAAVAAFSQGAGPFQEVAFDVRQAGEVEQIIHGDVVTDGHRDHRVAGWACCGDESAFPLTRESLQAQVEPTRIAISNTLPSSSGKVYAYNRTHRQYLPADPCVHTAAQDVLVPEYVLACGPLDPPVLLLAGRQTEISQRPRAGELRINSRVNGAITAEDCEPIPPADWLDDTDDAPRCNEVLREFNGVAGPSISITGGDGVSVKAHPQYNRIVLDFGSKNLEICPPQEEDPTPVTYSPVDENGIICGPYGEELTLPDEIDHSSGYTISVVPSPPPPSTAALHVKANQCLWQVVSGQWEVVRYACVSPSTCMPPGLPATQEGQVVTTPCLIPAYHLDNFIRNGTFDWNPKVPFASWDINGTPTLEDTVNGVGGPWLLLIADEHSSATLIQRTIDLARGNYALQFKVKLASGKLVTRLFDENSKTLLYSFETVQQSSDVQQIVHGPFNIAGTQARLEIEYFPFSDQPVMLGFLALVPQDT